MKLSHLIESRGTPVIVVDYQPAYDKWIKQGMSSDLMAFLNKQTGRILAYFNGNNQTYDSQIHVELYMLENGIKEQRLDTIEFTQKTYGWLRLWMDKEIPPDIIIKVIRFMYQNKLEDSTQLTDKDLASFLSYHDMLAWGDDLQDDYDYITVPELSIAKLKQFNKCYICGGGKHECLREIEIMMNAFNIKYTRLERFIF